MGKDRTQFCKLLIYIYHRSQGDPLITGILGCLFLDASLAALLVFCKMCGLIVFFSFMVHSIFAKIVTCSEKIVCTLSIHDFIMGIVLFNNIITTTPYLLY